MNNRLGDLPSWAHEDDGGDDDFEDEWQEGGGEEGKSGEEGGDIEMGPKKTKEELLMENFFREVDTIKNDIESVAKATKRIGDINEEALIATTTDEENALSEQLRPLIDKTNKLAKRTKNLLGLLKEETEKLKGEQRLKQSDLRIRENLLSTLTRKFIDEMKLYQSSQQKYKNDIKKKVKRQVQIVKPDATDQEIEEVMRSEGGRDALYRQRILAGGVSDQIKTTYAKVQGKYQDVMTLESSVAELHQMFLDFALLTEQQGELLDQIEYQVKQAGDHIDDANVEMIQAVEIQKKVRKKQCYIILIVVVVLLVIVVAIAV